ncbi:MAG: kynureninase [Acidimicrobiia bacterium]|nr:kynureninase [Acidimicrobiia bacterium]MBT8215833.1 kynureninase [Acidimicrobiia bacterium]NNF10994.1 kynureninase [Acidimicrobiia bacterium]NNL68860.1 kynureninase [Acidimicrobiia bacterium]
MTTRRRAEELDQADLLADFREQFVITDPGLLYLDGNSLGRLPKRTIEAVETALHGEWGDRLVRAWPETWIEQPRRIGADLAGLIGAQPDEVLLADQTSINLYKLAVAALRARAPRRTVLTDSGNFPSDSYVLSGAAADAGGSIRIVNTDPVAPSSDAVGALLDDEVALVSMSHVNYKSGALHDMAAVTAAARSAGALSLWDLSHSVGAVPIDLNGAGVDLAVGCTYKYLNGGPGAPAFLFVARHLQEELEQPIHGWWGHADMFAFEGDYHPAPGIDRFAVGTIPVLSMVGAREGIALTAEAGIEAIRTKSMAITSFMTDLFDELPAEFGFIFGSPRDPARRGSHVSLRHPDGYQIAQALIRDDVVPDFRAPDVIRLGAAPLYTRFVDVWDAFARLRTIMESGSYRTFPKARARVT